MHSLRQIRIREKDTHYCLAIMQYASPSDAITCSLLCRSGSTKNTCALFGDNAVRLHCGMQCSCPANAAHLADSGSVKNTCALFGDNAVRLTVGCKTMQFTRRLFVPRKK